MKVGADPSREQFGRWVIEHHGMVWAVCFAVLRDASVADEVVQDTFMTAYQRRRQLDDPSRPGPWLRTLARNQAIDRLRRRRRESEARRVHRTTETAETPTSSPEAAMAEALEALDPDSQALLLQFHLEGRTSQELAAQWGSSDAAIRKRLSRAREVLRDEYRSQLARWATPPRRAAMVAAAVLAALPAEGQAARRWGPVVGGGMALLGLMVAALAVRDPAPAPVVVPSVGPPAVARSEARERTPEVASEPLPAVVVADSEPEADAFREAATALATFDEDVTLLECPLPQRLTEWVPHPSPAWAFFEDHHLSAGALLGMLPRRVEQRIEGSLVFEHEADATRTMGFRYLVEPSDDGPLRCSLVRLDEVTDEDLLPNRTPFAPQTDFATADRAAFARQLMADLNDERDQLEAGDHPLQRARAVEGLSPAAIGFLDEWIAASIAKLDKLTRIDLSKVGQDDIEEDEPGVVTIFAHDAVPDE